MNLMHSLVAIILPLPSPLVAQPSEQQRTDASSVTTIVTHPIINPLSVAIGTGAVASVVAFNLAVLGWGAVPGGIDYGTAAIVPAEMAVAMNRVWAVSTGVGGGWLGEYLYNSNTNGEGNRSSRLLSIGMGAMLGVTAFTAATYTLGPVPGRQCGGGGGAGLNPAGQSADCGGLGRARRGDGGRVYDAATGRRTDWFYGLKLFSGAMIGVAAVNILTYGTLGSMSNAIGVGAGAVTANSMIASALAAAMSRVMAVSGVIVGSMIAELWPN